MLRVIVADDSPVARELIAETLNADPDIEVIGLAQDGAEAVSLVTQLQPDVVTMDLQMPRMDGFRATEEIMIEQPTPIVVVSGSIESHDVEKSMNSIRAGALTIIGKPPSPQSERFEAASRELVETVKAMAKVKVVRRKRSSETTPTSGSPDQQAGPAPAHGRRYDVIAIATSTGGPQALHELLSPLPADFPVPILLVQHISDGFADGFATWLSNSISLSVKTACDGERIRPSTVYLAPEGYHLGVDGTSRIAVTDQPSVGGFRPSATVLFDSVAGPFRDRALAILLTGMGDDGVDGLRAVKETGGHVIAQDEETCVVYGMPRAAAEAGLVDQVLPLDRIRDHLVTLTADRRA